MLDRLDHMSLTRQLICIAFLCVLLPLLVSSLLLYRSAVDAYSQLSLRAGQLSLQRAEDLVEKALGQAVKAADNIVTDQHLMEMMQRAKADYPAAQRIDDMSAIRKKLVACEMESGVLGVRLVWPRKVQWLSNNNHIGLSMDAFQILLAQNGLALTDGALQGAVWLPRSELAGESGFFSYPTITYARMIRNIADYDQLIGFVLVMQIREQYTALLQEADFSGETLLTLCGPDGEVIAQSGDSVEAQRLWTQYIQQDMPAGQMQDGAGNVRVLARSLQSNGWRLIALLPFKEYQSQVAAISLQTAALVVLLTVAALLLANRLYRFVLRRVDRIIVCMERVEHGDLSVKLPAYGNNELSRMERHFNLMLGRINALLQKTRDMAERDRLLRIRLLQTQINPHFLYNTLNSILWTAMDYRADKVCQMLKALSDFYKIGLQPGREEAPLEHELLHAKRYVTLQNLRGTLQVQLTISCEETLFDLRVPNMMLQPLVENSILHGFAQRVDGVLTICAQRVAGNLCIEISDDGIGMTRAECEQMLRMELPEHAYGIYSIYERLKLRYGERADLQLNAGPLGKGLTTRILIPLEDEAEERKERALGTR